MADCTHGFAEKGRALNEGACPVCLSDALDSNCREFEKIEERCRRMSQRAEKAEAALAAFRCAIEHCNTHAEISAILEASGPSPALDAVRGAMEALEKAADAFKQNGIACGIDSCANCLDCMEREEAADKAVETALSGLRVAFPGGGK